MHSVLFKLKKEFSEECAFSFCIIRRFLAGLSPPGACSFCPHTEASSFESSPGIPLLLARVTTPSFAGQAPPQKIHRSEIPSSFKPCIWFTLPYAALPPHPLPVVCFCTASFTFQPTGLAIYNVHCCSFSAPATRTPHGAGTTLLAYGCIPGPRTGPGIQLPFS